MTVPTVPSATGVRAEPRAVLPALGLVAAPTLYTISTLLWQDDGIYGTEAAPLVAVALVCWLLALQPALGLVAVDRPRLAAWTRVVLAAGVAGGVCFAARGFYDGALGLSREESIAVLDDHPFAAAVMFFVPGPLFPLSLVITGIALAVGRRVAPAIGLAVAVTGLIFPVTTVLRSHLGATGLGALMMLAFGALALSYVRPAEGRRSPEGSVAHEERGR